MSALIRAVVGLPLRLATSIARRPVSFVLVMIGVQRRRTYRLAVAGLSAEKAQPIYFALRRAATTAEVGLMRVIPSTLSDCDTGSEFGNQGWLRRQTD